MGDFRPPCPRKRPNGEIRLIGPPGEQQPPFGNIVGAGQKETRGEQGLFPDFSRTHDLGDPEYPDVGVKRTTPAFASSTTVPWVALPTETIVRVSPFASVSLARRLAKVMTPVWSDEVVRPLSSPATGAMLSGVEKTTSTQ